MDDLKWRIKEADARVAAADAARKRAEVCVWALCGEGGVGQTEALWVSCDPTRLLESPNLSFVVFALRMRAFVCHR
jgi:hypothetical protein